jgi:hypothetical protein
MTKIVTLLSHELALSNERHTKVRHQPDGFARRTSTWEDEVMPPIFAYYTDTQPL